MTFELYRDVAGKWRWRLRAGNDRLIANSGESYSNEGECRAAIALVMGTHNMTPIKGL